MAVKWLEPGGDADFGVALWNSVLGIPAVATDFVHGGHKRSLKYRLLNTDGVIASAVCVQAGGRLSFYVYLNATPSETDTFFGILLTGAGQTVIKGRLTTSRTLELWEQTNKIGSTGTNVLATGQWYRISLAYTISSTTVNQFRLFVDGNLEISVSNATITNVAASDFGVGNLGGAGTLDIRTSDHYLDDSTALTDTGDIWVTAKRPFANGTANALITQIGSGGSAYGSGHSPQVNERALSVTNGWSLSNTTKATEEYNIEGKTVGDIDISAATIVDYMGWIDADVASTANSPVHHIIVNGVATAVTMTTAAKIFRQIAGSAIYPAGTGTDIGLDAQYTTTAHLTSLFEAGIVVAYKPSRRRSFPLWV